MISTHHKQAIFLDFDGTLFDKERFFAELWQRFAKFGIDDKMWHEAYAQIPKGSYTIMRHIETITELNGIQIDEKQVRAIMSADFKDLQRFVFADALPFLKQLQELPIDIFILSVGTHEWQEYKITASGLKQYVKETIIVEQPHDKAIYLADTKSRYEKIYFVDDWDKLIAGVKKQAPFVKTFWLQRTNAPDPQEQKIQKTSTIHYSNLNQIYDMIKSDWVE